MIVDRVVIVTYLIVKIVTTVNSQINLGSVFLVEMTRQHSEWNVDDDEGEYCCPDGDVFNQLLAQVVEDCRKVDGVDGSDEPGSEPTEQVTAEPYTLRTCRFDLHPVKRFQRFQHEHFANVLTQSWPRIQQCIDSCVVTKDRVTYDMHRYAILYMRFRLMLHISA